MTRQRQSFVSGFNREAAQLVLSGNYPLQKFVVSLDIVERLMKQWVHQLEN
ncbi:MAG: hypothetical protein R3254_02530 [Thiomicrorhabdus sp.]|nr:hypothetical protein [Thiomicrorhabdus sp.]